MTKKPRLEEDGLFVDRPEHWEMWETRIYLQRTPYKSKYRTKDGEVRTYPSIMRKGIIGVPTAIFDHLKLKNKDKIVVAIKKVEAVGGEP